MVLIAIAALHLPAKAEQTTVMVGVRQNMQATLVTPDGRGPYPAVLVLHTSGGLEPADIAYAQALANVGYVALVPAFLQAYGVSSSLRRETFTTDAEPIYADLVAAIVLLQRNSKVAAGRIGAIGFSNGGYFAAWLAATGKVQAGVSYYGALSGAGTDIPLKRFTATFTKTSAPMLILHGTADQTVPVGAAQHLGRIIADAGSPYEIKLYDGASHRFDRDRMFAGNRAAADDAWQRTQTFLARYLGGHN